MRKIKFRGKAKMSIEELNDMYFEHDNGWFYGNLVMYGDTPYIVGDFIDVDQEFTVHEFWVAVHPESVGQFTGLKDKNGKEIYEGDIVNLTHMVYAGYGNVDEVTEAVVIEDLTKLPFGSSTITCEAIGNIYENPELLEGEK